LKLFLLEAKLCLVLILFAFILLLSLYSLQIIIVLILNLVYPNPWKYSKFYRGKHALVTGGSSGIGLAVAKEYLKLGCKVTIVARDIAKLEEAQKSLKIPERTQILSLDVSSNQDTVNVGVQKCVETFGEINILVNCAGTSTAAEFDQTDPNEFLRLMKINYLGSVYVTRAVVESMKQKRDGRIVFVASQVAQAALHGYTAYAASKWALRGLAEALQQELKPHNVYVSVSYPPDTDTPGYEIEMKDKPEITKTLSEGSAVYSAEYVAKGIVRYSGEGYFGIGVGPEGFLLKHLHAGMSPVNNFTETCQQLVMYPICRLISIVVVLFWDFTVWNMQKNAVKKTAK